MTVKLWTGASDGDMSVAGNYSPSGVPIATDDLLFDGNATNAPSANMDALNAILLGTVYVGEDWVLGDIGASGTPFETSATKWVFRHSAYTAYVEITNAGSGSDEFIVNSVSAADPAVVVSSTGIGGAMGYMAVSYGHLDASGWIGTGTVNVAMGYRGSKSNVARMTIGAGGSWRVYQAAGYIVASSVPEVHISGGQMDIISTLGGSGKNIRIMGGALVNYDATDDLDEVVIMDGTMDTLGATRAFTINRARVFPDGLLKYSADLVTINSGAGPDDMTGGDVQI